MKYVTVTDPEDSSERSVMVEYIIGFDAGFRTYRVTFPSGAAVHVTIHANGITVCHPDNRMAEHPVAIMGERAIRTLAEREELPT